MQPVVLAHRPIVPKRPLVLSECEIVEDFIDLGRRDALLPLQRIQIFAAKKVFASCPLRA